MQKCWSGHRVPYCAMSPAPEWGGGPFCRPPVFIHCYFGRYHCPTGGEPYCTALHNTTDTDDTITQLWHQSQHVWCFLGMFKWEKYSLLNVTLNIEVTKVGGKKKVVYLCNIVYFNTGISISNHLGVAGWLRLKAMGGKGSVTDLMNKWISDGGVCRAAPGFARVCL